jgi:hypothetical protein
VDSAQAKLFISEIEHIYVYGWLIGDVLGYGKSAIIMSFCDIRDFAINRLAHIY